MNTETGAVQSAKADAALRKTEAEIWSLDVNTLVTARRFWLEVGKFTIMIVPLAAGALKFRGDWL